MNDDLMTSADPITLRHAVRSDAPAIGAVFHFRGTRIREFRLVKELGA
jgi:hypothetical protein